MTRHASAVTKDVTKDQLIDEFNAVVADTEQLLRSAAVAGGEKAGALRSGVEQSLASVKERLRSVQHATLEKTKATAQAADAYVHEHPWRGIGIASGVTVVLGVVIGLLLNRR